MQLPAALRRVGEIRPRRSRSGRGPLVVVSWDQQQIDFLVVTRRSDSLRVLRRGRIERGEDQRPLEQLAEHLRSSDHKGQRLVLLLPRSELDLAAVEVPSANDDELPALVQMEVDQSVGESDRGVVVDYVRAAPSVSPSDNAEEESPVSRVIAYWMFEEDRDRVRGEAQQAGFHLEAISARQLGPLAVLQSQQVLRGPLTVVIAFYAGEIEFTFFRGAAVLFLRSVRVANQAVESLADQIQTEVRRTASLTSVGGLGEEIELVLLARGDVGPEGGELAREQLAETLSARVIGSQGPVRSDAFDEDPVLWGAASDYLLGQLPVNMLAPKKSPVPPNPLYRWAGIAAAAVAAVVVAGYVLVAEVRDLESEVSQRQSDVEEATQMTAKIQEKADEARFVRSWLSDQVDWLEQLRRMSDEFPDGQSANVRRLSATAGETGGRFELSVQIKNPELVARMEDRLRDAGFQVSSGQISEQTGGGEYAWQFDTQIGFRQTPLEEKEDSESFVSRAEGPATRSDDAAPTGETP